MVNISRSSAGLVELQTLPWTFAEVTVNVLWQIRSIQSAEKALQLAQQRARVLESQHQRLVFGFDQMILKKLIKW